MAYSSTLALSVFSGLALATSDKSKSEYSKQKQDDGTEVVNLVNHTASEVTIDHISVAIAPGEELSLVVASSIKNNKKLSANNKNLFIKDVLDSQLTISSEYAEFNGIVPISVFKKASSIKLKNIFIR